MANAGVGSMEQRRLQTANLHIHPSSESPVPPFLYSHNHPFPRFSRPPCHIGSIAGVSLVFFGATAITYCWEDTKSCLCPDFSFVLFEIILSTSPTLISGKLKSSKTCSFHSLIRQFPRSWHSPQLAPSANQWPRDVSQGSSTDGCLPLIFLSFYLPVHKEGMVITLISKGSCGGRGWGVPHETQWVKYLAEFLTTC